jgi:hypothetical protein
MREAKTLQHQGPKSLHQRRASGKSRLYKLSYLNKLYRRLIGSISLGRISRCRKLVGCYVQQYPAAGVGDGNRRD